MPRAQATTKKKPRAAAAPAKAAKKAPARKKTAKAAPATAAPPATKPRAKAATTTATVEPKPAKRAPARRAAARADAASLAPPAPAVAPAASAPADAPGFAVHPSVAMVQQWVAGLEPRTGRTLDQWIDLAQREGPKQEKPLRDWLIAKGLGANGAWWVVERVFGRGQEDSDPDAYLRAAASYVDAMYAGPKAGLRAIHDAILSAARALGPDVRVSPCKTMVPIYRTHVIAHIKPASRERIDLGLALGNTRPTRRLLDTGGLARQDRITRAVSITSPAEVDDEVVGWLRAAYERDA